MFVISASSIHHSFSETSISSTVFSNRQTQTCREGICQSTCDPFERCIYLLRTSHSSHIFDNLPRFQSSFISWPISFHVLLQCGHCAQLVRWRAFLRALNDAQNDFG